MSSNIKSCPFPNPIGKERCGKQINWAELEEHLMKPPHRMIQKTAVEMANYARKVSPKPSTRATTTTSKKPSFVFSMHLKTFCKENYICEPYYYWMSPLSPNSFLPDDKKINFTQCMNAINFIMKIWIFRISIVILPGKTRATTTTSKTKPSFNITSLINTHDSSIATVSPIVTSGAAAATKTRSNLCYKCGQHGHIARECPHNNSRSGRRDEFRGGLDSYSDDSYGGRSGSYGQCRDCIKPRSNNFGAGGGFQSGPSKF
ncbi:unnamed protein product [Adineta steineri]|uniref:CCHC-type domain-containing protein n=1 Tax=Adineta steineri TaxID=433720 RepID=A0A819FEI5_9BILA|nr:unnamed protein product [Adineta steineri]